MKTKFILCAFLLVFLTPCMAEIDANFYSEVLCPNKERFLRFDGIVKLHIQGNIEGKRGRVHQTVSKFNEICEGLDTKIEIVDSERDANIVFVIEFRYYNEIRVERVSISGNKLKRVNVLVGCGTNWAAGMIDSDSEKFFFSLLCEAMGFSKNGVDTELDTIWRKSTTKNPNTFDGPTEIDKKLIRFAYSRVPSGTSYRKLQEIIKRENFFN